MLASADGKWGNCRQTVEQNGLVDLNHVQRNRQAALDVSAASDHWNLPQTHLSMCFMFYIYKN